MQWQSFIVRQSKGMVSLSILLLVAVSVTILQGFFLLVNKENEAQKDNIRQEQILNLELPSESLHLFHLSKGSLQALRR